MSENVNNAELLSFVERIERIDEQINALKEDRKAVLSEAKETGFIPKAINHVIKERRKAEADREEERSIFQTYEDAVGL